VNNEGESFFAAVDRIRSIPLFYAIVDGHIYISDDAYWVSDQLGINDYDELSVAEFLLTGYVTGKETLRPKVKQIQAGEVLIAQEIPEPHVITEHYYRYLPKSYFRDQEKSLFTNWEAVLIRAFRRLVYSVDGRPIVIPLSGGYDSRLIAIMLKRLHYDNVICFSYGKPGNWESKVSEYVARKLGFRWEFVPYSLKKWYEWFHSDECEKYIRYADGLVSVAHLQDWPAVWEMKKQGLIPENSVFVPGHTVFSCGDPMPAEIEAEQVGLNKLVHAIFRKHYNLWHLQRLRNMLSWQMPIEELRSKLERKITSLIGDTTCVTQEEAANAYGCWEWQESEAKFICNSVRVYEFWGYEWRMPLWDAEIMSFWERLPLRYRLRKRFHKMYVEQIQDNYLIQEPKGYTAFYSSATNLHRKAKKILYTIRRPPRQLRISSFRERARACSHYYEHSLCWYGIVSIEQFLKLYSEKENIYSFLVLKRMGLLNE
jgi:asparagine synthase (glutamine-hydrolysing)